MLIFWFPLPIAIFSFLIQLYFEILDLVNQDILSFDVRLNIENCSEQNEFELFSIDQVFFVLLIISEFFHFLIQLIPKLFFLRDFLLFFV
jgi:hypothetical protein